MLNNNLKNIKNNDVELWNIIQKENIRQENNIELIASENYASNSVMEAQGSQLTNKYAEGYPGNRYYGGCDYADEVEQLAINRAKKLFNAIYANVQPHSGSQANFAVYSTLLNPGDLVLSMDLLHGGHLTHGSSVNFSGKLYKFIHYGTNNLGQIDYQQIYDLSIKYKPKMIVGGFSSYSGKINWYKIRQIANITNSYLFVDMAHVAGLVAAGIYPNPIPYAHIVTTTTHKTLAGPRGGLILSGYNDDEMHRKINSSVFPGSQGGPLLHVIAAKAIAFKEAMDYKFIIYQKQIIKNAKSMVSIFLKRNFIVVSSGTTNHLLLLDLTNKQITGKDAELILSKSNIIVNKNCIPYDRQSPLVTSGIRIGTSAITRRGFNEQHSKKIANWICDILDNINNEILINNIKNKVLNICKEYPVYFS
ncbi:MAG: serine hydroxymethyltransferase [Enterobacterales bacterium]